MSDSQKPYIGIDLGGTNIGAGIVTTEGKLLADDKVKTKAQNGSDTVIKRITKVIEKIVDQANLKMDDIAGIGIGAPGAINIKDGVVMEAVNLRWNNYPLAKILSKETHLPVILDNDVNVGTWGEFKIGGGKNTHNMLGIFIGTGIGGGLILHNHLYYGHHMTAGEIGHTLVKADGSLGRRTLENLASRTSIAQVLAKLIQSNHASIISKLTEGDLTKIRSRVIGEAFKQNDKLTKIVIGDAAKYVGIAIANTVTLLSLPHVVLGGGLTEALGEPWVKMVHEHYENHVFPHGHECNIVASQLGDHAGVIGAGLLAHHRLTEGHKI
ncbi:ROK family protein [Poriferisphaera sp. WC338]|uniref:ROK family protein n=1 Tax=Poriferisphaera sp. WC338 TaxID=3425129 RepID=UPI003D81809A